MSGRGNRDAELLERHREDLAAAAARAAARRGPPRRPTRERWKREAIARRRALERLEAAELERRPRGPNLPLWMMRNERVYVTRSDLDELAGGRGPALFRRHWRELELRAAADVAELLPLELALLYLLVWCHLRRPGGDGAGLQVEIGDLAELLPGRAGRPHLSRSWAYELVGRLEKKGLVHRRRRVRRYLNLMRQLGPAGAYADTEGELHPFRRWKDRDGKLREFVDVQGVLYATPKAVELVLRPVRRGRRVLEHGLWTELWRTLRAAARNATARLSAAGGARSYRTPYAVSALLEMELAGQEPARAAATGPPGPPTYAELTRRLTARGPEGRAMQSPHRR